MISRRYIVCLTKMELSFLVGTPASTFFSAAFVEQYYIWEVLAGIKGYGVSGVPNKNLRTQFQSNLRGIVQTHPMPQPKQTHSSSCNVDLPPSSFEPRPQVGILRRWTHKNAWRHFIFNFGVATGSSLTLCSSICGPSRHAAWTKYTFAGGEAGKKWPEKGGQRSDCCSSHASIPVSFRKSPPRLPALACSPKSEYVPILVNVLLTSLQTSN